MRRVVVTGMAGISPIGSDWPTVERRLREKSGSIVVMPGWEKIAGLRTRLGSPVLDFAPPAHWDRRRTRSLGRVSFLAVRATEMALLDAGLLDDPVVRSGEMGIAYGSSTGSTEAIGRFAQMRFNENMRGINATTYIQMMSHTCAVNVALFFEMKGRIVPTCSACTSGSQGIGYAYEAIKSGKQTLMAAGGAEELCVTEAAVFDVLFATSTKNDAPDRTPRPFDRDRDGLVVGEGAGTLILEELSHAQARGARIHAELVGFGTNSDGAHVTNPTWETMAKAMRHALDDAALAPDAVGYVNAHATGTELGDIAESIATANVFGNRIPISCLKSYVGHTLGACGALEAWMTIEMMNRGWFAPTIHLDAVDPRCAELDYIRGDGRLLRTEYAASNNFAFGGINPSLIFKRWTG
jgi:3-oxoacyl-[acyl-carrier-protein] synthase II